MTLFVFGEALWSIAVNLFTDLRLSEFKYFVGAGGVILFKFGGKVMQSDILVLMLSISGKVLKTVIVLLLVPLSPFPLLGKVLKLVIPLQSISFTSVLIGDLAILTIPHFCLMEYMALREIIFWSDCRCERALVDKRLS